MENKIKHGAKAILSQLFQSGIAAVNGQVVIERALENRFIEGDIAVIAIGKAATAMMRGAENALNKQIQSALIITKEGYADKSLMWPCLEAGHPIPNESSLKAGAKLLEFLSLIPKNIRLLILISGGASALVEVLPNDMSLAVLQKMNQWLLCSGLDIHAMNRIRQSVSLIKGGKALQALSNNKVSQFLISDVRYDDPEIIGSGLFVNTNKNKPLAEKMPAWLKEYVQPRSKIKTFSVETHIVANNDLACQKIIEQAKEANYAVIDHGQSLYGDVFDLAEKIASELQYAQSGIHIWGGEPTIELPEIQGQGGRNQSLALALACHIENSKNLTILVGATDGSDGTTDDAGAIVDGRTIQRGGSLQQAKESLQKADAGTFLAAAGDLLSTGPTGTNVMDIVIVWKEE